ncbi:DUF2510 domain-containing protein [Intrasporangium sp. YIM S08009]|uniref:DUF2510 domain-containing protein n=1 Tax=Intrasporangium zincisolvens TaxID=3080018 RepID=UPI002B059395|nr:DUF2510 domain-containing protein [Intrasporangium sp. YIM S08009]
MNERPAAPAGWYPAGEGERYWDGQAWTPHTRPAMAPPVPTDAYGLPHQGAGPTQWAAPGAPVHFTQVAPKNPAVSLLASFFLPGLGSMINGDVGKGVGILIGYFVSWLFVIVLVGFVGVFGFWVWGMVDGYQGARRWNAQHGIYS